MACNAINQGLIDRYSECDGRPKEFGLAFDVSGFVQGSMLPDLEYECSRVGLDVAAGEIHFDAAMLPACLGDVRALTCNYLYGAIVNLPDSCNAVLAGTVDHGGACRLTQECKGNYEQCEDGPTACPGSCQGVPASITPLCAVDGGPASACTVEQACDVGTGTCVPRSSKTSGPCNGSLDCAGGYQCTNGGTNAAYACVAYKRIGAACKPGTNECSPGTYCDSNACAVWPSLGGECGNIAGETVGCLDGTCTASDSMARGKCVARLAVGSPCEEPPELSTDPCVPGAACVAGQCIALECL
jgi:hypothetical protein